VQSGVLIIIVTVAKEVAVQIGKSIGRIITGRPENTFEREAADALRRFINQLLSKSRLMNPGVP